MIPFAANSIDVRLTSTDGTRLLGEALLTKPTGGGTTTAFFDTVPTGTVLLTGTAFPNSDGSGIAQARAQTTVTVVAGQTSTVALTLASTITRFAIKPTTATLTPGQTISATTLATDAAGQIVLTGISTISWQSSNLAVATVDASGLVRAVAAGTASITATETESGKSGTLAVVVSSPAAPALVYDGFNYTTGTSLTGQNGGVGWTGAWASHGPGTLSTIISGSLTFGNLVVSGNAFRTTSFSPIGDERNWNATISTTPGTVLFWSILIKPEAVSGGSPDSYFGFGIADQFFGKGGRYDTLGIEQAGGSNEVSTGIHPQPNTTYFLVVRATYATAGDTYDLFVNPTPGQPLPDNPSVSKTVPHVTQTSTGFGSGGSVPCVYDELRFGTTWESVSPVSPSP